MDKNKKICITTGDLLGIGEEITIKALNSLNLPEKSVVIIGKNINKHLKIHYETIEIDPSDNGRHCFLALEEASKLALKGDVNAIVTAPVSKEALYKSGYKYSGQTEILEKFLGDKEHKAEMMFISDDLRVLLLTRHLALKDIVLDEKTIIKKVLRTNRFLVERCGILKPKFALCALNPHAGENGILGSEEKDIMLPAVEKLKAQGIDMTPPLSADGLFAGVGARYLNGDKQLYDCILASYHDQGLCPVKALCFKKVVNTTIGLKVIRTSPSSGTAYDIAGKGIADPSGMEEAVKLAIKLA